MYGDLPEPSERMLLIHSLTSFDAARFAWIATGYTSRQRYAVRKEERDGRTTFTLEMEELEQPYTRHWDEDEEQYRQYEQVVSEQGLSLGAYDGDRLVGVAIAER